MYLSTNTTITTSDTEIGSYTEAAQLGPGSAVTVMKAFWVPSSLSPGTYYVGVRVDTDSWVAESDESNNSAAASSSTVISG